MYNRSMPVYTRHHRPSSWHPLGHIACLPPFPPIGTVFGLLPQHSFLHACALAHSHSITLPKSMAPTLCAYCAPRSLPTAPTPSLFPRLSILPRSKGRCCTWRQLCRRPACCSLVKTSTIAWRRHRGTCMSAGAAFTRCHATPSTS